MVCIKVVVQSKDRSKTTIISLSAMLLEEVYNAALSGHLLCKPLYSILM